MLDGANTFPIRHRTSGYQRSMESLRKILHYLANLEWTEKKQHDCVFCDRENLRNVIHEVCKVIEGIGVN